MGGRIIDLHTHTMASDGTDTPAQLIEHAVEAGLSSVALTDHDTLDGLAEAEEAAGGKGLEFIRGCELAIYDPTFGELHLLGLWMPQPSQRMKAALADIQARRLRRNQEMVRRLCELGLPLVLEDVQAVAGGKAIGRPHIAEALRRKGYVTTIMEAFERYIGRAGAAFVPRELSSPREGISLLAEEGATVVFAHPCLDRDMSGEVLNDLLADFRGFGLTALEAYHSAHDAKSVRLCVRLAKKHNLLLSGGSDYHGRTKPGVRLGVGKGGMRVPYQLLETLRDDRRRRGLWV